MTSECPKVTPSGRYTVMQTCRALGIDRNTLRSYTVKGYIKCVYRPDTRKVYKGSEITRFWLATV